MSETSKPRWSITAAKYRRARHRSRRCVRLASAARARAYRAGLLRGETAQHSIGLVPTPPGKASNVTSFNKRHGAAIATLLACTSLGVAPAAFAAGGGGEPGVVEPAVGA